ncbi:MAG: nuclear transport factor 2 family protein [Chitinophagaceae bacterium]|nr:nuclear transport factor 2 family protein [Chitinophagaceae bacterium]
MRVLLLLLTTACISFNASAQSAEDSVKATVNGLFTAMRNADPSGVTAVFSSNAVLQTISRDKEGKTVVKDEKVSEFAESLKRTKKDSADERITFEKILIDGPLATVWTPYNFYYNGAFSHCGVNSFQLVRIDGIWKIQYIIDTRRRAGCKP